MDKVSKLIYSGSIDDLVSSAKDSGRKRAHLNLHEDYSERCQILFNAIEPGSYIRPHRHLLDPKVETLLPFRGSFLLVIFDDVGKVVLRERMQTLEAGDCVGVRIDPSEWHTVVSLEPGSILLEVKPGPFNPHLAKQLASWAPLEGEDTAGEYLENICLGF